MSDLMSAIRDDINEYRRLCEQYGEKVQYQQDYYGHYVEDCYGEHSRKLDELDRARRNNERY